MSASKSELVVPRRSALLGAAAMAAAPLARPFIANATAAETIKIGLLLAKTGDIAAQTEYLANGTYLALEERGNKIMGQPAELVWLDEPSPQGSQQNMQRLVQENKVVAILGGSLSSNGLAEQATAAQLKIPFVCNNAAATDMSGKNCNHYTFRLNTPVAVQAAMFAPYIMGYGKKWYFLTANYAFGQDIAKSFKEILAKAGGTIVGDDVVPLNTPDYSSFILKIRQAKPDMILGGVPAGDLSTFLKQWNEMGMKGSIPDLRDRHRRYRHLGSRDRKRRPGSIPRCGGTRTRTIRRRRRRWLRIIRRNTASPRPTRHGWAGSPPSPCSNRSNWRNPPRPRRSSRVWKAGRAARETNPYYWRKGDHQMLLRNLVVQVKPKIPTNGTTSTSRASCRKTWLTWTRCSAIRRPTAAI